MLFFIVAVGGASPHGLSLTFLPLLDALAEIDDKRNLRQTHDPRCPRNRLVPLESSQPPNRVITGHASTLSAPSYQRRCMPSVFSTGDYSRSLTFLFCARMKYWEIFADNLSASGWTWGCSSQIDSAGRVLFTADAHRSNDLFQTCRAPDVLHGRRGVDPV